MTTGYALAVAIFGGFAPFISIWLIERLSSPICSDLLPDRRRDHLDGGDLRPQGNRHDELA